MNGFLSGIIKLGQKGRLGRANCINTNRWHLCLAELFFVCPFFKSWGRRLIRLFFLTTRAQIYGKQWPEKYNPQAYFPNDRIEYLDLLPFLVGKGIFSGNRKKKSQFGNPAKKWARTYVRGYFCKHLTLSMQLCHCELGVWVQVPLPFHACVHLPQTSITAGT